jgi:hypothetical protein
MMVVIALIGLIAAISYPAVGTGLDSIRFASATDSVVSFLNAGITRADRRGEIVEISASLDDHKLRMQSTDPNFSRRLDLPEGITIQNIHPEQPGPGQRVRTFVIYPGGTVPRLGLELANTRGNRKIVRVDPITGVARIQAVEAVQQQ